MTSRLLVPLASIPIVGQDGNLTVNPAKYSRNAITMAFEMMGGVEGLAEWADKNKTDFYTKLFTKIVGREIEIGVSEDVESMLDMLDKGMIDVTPTEAETTDQEPVERFSDMKRRLLCSALVFAESEDSCEY